MFLYCLTITFEMDNSKWKDIDFGNSKERGSWYNGPCPGSRLCY